MPHSDDEKIAGIEARLWHDDPRFARSLGAGRPRQPREYRRGWAWLALAYAIAAVALGMILVQGLLLASGLIVAGIAAYLLDPGRAHRRRSARPGP
jgi:hypothetical protein